LRPNHETPSLHAAEEVEAGGVQVFLPADIRQPAEHILAIDEPGDDDLSRPSSLVLHGYSFP
jgi:hypothetical protein